jgi:capsular polysaccharide biosynthesis protein
MLRGPRIQTYLEAIYERRKVARDVLLGVLILSGMFALWAGRYSATATVQLTSTSPQQARAHALDLARSTLSDERLAAILQQAQLYPEMVRTRGQATAVEYMRSRISLRAAGRGDNTGEVQVTYLSSEKATALKVANALAQSLTEVKPSAADLLSANTAETIERQLEESRSELKELEAHRHRHARRLRTSVHRASVEYKKTLIVPELQKGQTSEPVRAGSSAVSVPLPETSAVKATQQQIKDAEARLVALRERYTDQYPDVQDTQEQLQELRSKLRRLQADSAASAKEPLPARDYGRMIREEEQKETQPEATTGTKREKSSKASTAARTYALELDRYHALLRAQKSMKEYQDKGLGSLQPPFRVVETANRAKAAGLAVNPLYWLSSLLTGLFAATLTVLFAHRLDTPPREQIVSRSQFEPEELAPHYRHGTR